MASNKDTTLKLIRQYEALVERGLAQGDLSKIPSFAAWVEKKHGRSAMRLAQTVIHEFPQEFSTPKIAEARDTLLKTLIAEANQGEKFVELNTLLDKVNVVEGGRVRGGLFDKNSPLLHTKEDKVRMAFDNIVEADEIIEWPKKSTKNLKYAKTPLMAMIGERTGVSGPQYMDAVLAKGKLRDSNFSKLNIYKPKHIYDKELVRIAGNTGVIESGKPFSEIMADAKYRAGGGVQWSKAQGVRPDPAETINNFALRHWDHHKRYKTRKSQIEFFWNKKKDAKGNPLAVDWETVPKNKRGFKSLKGSQVFFRYKNENWGIDKLRREGRQSKLFKEVYAAKQEYNQLLAKPVPDPNNPNKKISFETLMKRTYKTGYDTLGNIYAVDHEKLVADKPFNALRVASRRLNDQLSYIAHHAKQKNFKKILTNALDLTQLDDPLRAGQELAEEVLVEGYKSPLTGPQELAQTVLKKDVGKLSRPMVNQLVNLFSVSTNEELVRPILDAANLPGAKICGVVFGQGKRFGTAAGGPPGGCPDEMAQALNENPDEVFKKVAESKQKGGALGRASNWAKNILTKVPKGGRLGAILAGAGAVGAGTWAMMGGAEADETQTTDDMKFNATEGKFVKPDGDPETQEGILNWIGEHPIYSGLAAIPVGMGAGLGAGAMGFKEAANFFGSAKFILPPAYAAEKLYQYKEGQDLGEMFTNPLDAVWAMALDTKATGMSPGGAKAAYYAKAGEPLGLKNLNPKRWRETGSALKRATMAPASRGTRLVFPFGTEKYGFGAAKPLATKGLARAAGIGARMLPLGPIPMALLAGSMAWDKYKFNKKIGDHVDALRSQGVVSEEDAETMNTIYKQGWLGTTAIGAKILGSEELMFEGEMLDIEAQKKILSGMKDFYEGREEKEEEFRAGERQEDFFSWFSGGGRVGLAEGGNKKPFGSMTRRGFLKWLVGSIAAGVAAVSGKGLKQAAKTTATTVAKTPAKFIGVEGMPLWFPRAVAKIKTHGKLIEMADKHYVGGDVYEMMIPIQRTYSLSGRKGHTDVRTEMEKVIMEDNPLSGEINMRWTGTDNFGGDAIREINFKPGQAGYQKFGVDDAEAASRGVTEYQRVKVEEPEFTYTQPDQSQPMRDDIEYLDIFEEGDEIVKGLEDMTVSKNMVTKDGTVIDVSAEGKLVDKEFQKKIFKDIEGEGQIIPEPEGTGVSQKGDVYGEEQFQEIIGGEIPEHLKKKAEGGIIETGNIARRPGAVPPLSGPTPQGRGILGLFSSPKRVNIT